MNKEKTYKVGDVVWHAVCEMRSVTKTCPVCFGRRKVVLILGNDDRVSLDCDYCGRGFDAPTGTISEYEYVAKPEQRTITRVDIQETEKGCHREYLSHSRILYPADIFDTEQEAKEHAARKAAKQRLEEALRCSRSRDYSNKSYSWKAGYYRRMAQDAREDAERYGRHAAICRAHARPQKKG